MGNPRLLISNEGLQLKNPPSPKLIYSGNMSQTKAVPGPPKSPKSPDDNSPSQTKPVRSPSYTKSSPGSSKSILAERLAQSVKSKSSAVVKSSASKSSPTSPNGSSISKTDISKGSIDQSADAPEKNKVCNGPNEIKLENSELPNGHQLDGIIENETSKSNEIKQDVSVESNQIEINENSEVEESEQLKCDSVDDNLVVIDENSVTKPLRIDSSVILKETSKKGVRQKVWEFLEENSLVVFPKPCFNRIPNFKGCSNSSQSLEKLEEFKKAKTVQVTPDKAQETARYLTLSWGKRLLVPLLRLKEGLLQNVSLPFAEPSIKMLKSASTQKGIRKWGTKLVTLDKKIDNIHIDMIIMGSVAVDKRGYRIGIGDGYCDLEFVILSSMNMVTDNTVVVTIVHDAQVFDSLPTEIFKPYDVPVDIIITPTEIIKIENRLNRPKDIFWNYISKRRLLEMPPLQLLRTQQEKDSVIDCTLKEVDSEPEEILPSPKTYKKFKGYRHRRTYSTRSETNDSVFKDTEVSKHRRSTSKQSSASALKNTNSKVKRKRAKSTSSQNRTNSTVRGNNNQSDKKEQRSSKKQNRRRTKSESAKTVASPVILSDSKNSNNVQANSPSINIPKNKRQPRQKQRQRQLAEIDKQSSNHQSNTKLNSNVNYNSRSNSRATRRDYIDQDFSREVSVGRKARTEYIPSPKKYYSQNRRYDNYSQERQYHGGLRSNNHVQQYDSNRSIVMSQNRYSNGPVVRQTRYFNGPMVRHNSYNGPSRQIDDNHHHIIRHNSYSNEPLSRQNSFYDGIISHRNSFSKGPTIRQDGYTNSRIFGPPPQYRNGMASQTNEESIRPRFHKNHFGYFNPNEKPNYSRSISGNEFVLKVGNIANNVRVRDLKAALMERGVKPLHITWRGPRGFAYLRYSNATDVNKDCVMGTLQNVRIKPNGVETAQTQTLIVTECQFS